MYIPLAEKYRPSDFSDVFGQEHILGNDKVLNRILKSGNIPNLIFYGPSGTGKTSVANLLSKQCGKKFYKINASNSNIKDLQDILSELDTLMCNNGIVLFIDEFQHFNRKVQQTLLEFIENGQISLIAATTENPNFSIFKALLSRSILVEFKPLSQKAIYSCLDRIIKLKSLEYSEIKLNVREDVLEYLIAFSNGDVRQGINALELAFNSTSPSSDGIIDISLDVIQNCVNTKICGYDFNGQLHYDILSCFQKSIRGSDVDASIYYLCRLIKSDALDSIIRRLLVICSEDIGLCNSNLSSVVYNLCMSARELGFPEARLPLAHATILLSISPKSCSVTKAIDLCMTDIDSLYISDLPNHLKDSHFEDAKKLGYGVNYLYPHDFPNNYVNQQYLPNDIANKKYFQYGDNKIEQSYKLYWEKIKK